MRKRVIGIIAGLALVLSGAEEVSAANGWEIPLNGGTTTSQTSSSVSLSISPGTVQTDLNAANASANPDEAGKVLSQTATITVGNTDGYTVYVSGNTNLTGRNDTNHKIPSITSAKTLGSMSNEWGYYGVLGDTEVSWNPSTSFQAMTSSQQTVATGSATSSSVTKKLTLFYGARVNDSVAEDFYGNTVTLSVVAQPRTVTTTVTKFGGITTMQEMTRDICKDAQPNDTALLIDERDGKKYWVTRMLNETCWMSQNLDLDIKSSGNLITVNQSGSNIWTDTAEWGDSAYPPQATSTSITAGDPNNDATYSKDLGEYVLNTPTATTACPANITGLSGCSAQGFVNVAGWTPSSDPNFYRVTSYKGTDGITDCTKPVNAAVNTEASGVCKIYDSHYLVGNYYQWNAATAGSGASKYANASICPKGWRLPTYSTTAQDGFGFTLQEYGVNDKLVGANGAGDTYNIALSPLFYVRTGNIAPPPAMVPLFTEAGQMGAYWTRTYSGTSAAYILKFNGSSLEMATLARMNSLPIRCVFVTERVIISGS